MSEKTVIALDHALPNADMVITALRIILATENLQTAKTFAQVALDYATNDEEALAEGRTFQDPAR